MEPEPEPHEPELFALTEPEPINIQDTVVPDLDPDPTWNEMTKVKKVKKSKNEMAAFWTITLLLTSVAES